MRYIDVELGTTFFFEHNWEYPKVRTLRGHSDLRDQDSGRMPDDTPVITVAELDRLRVYKERVEALQEKLYQRLSDDTLASIRVVDVWKPLSTFSAALESKP